MSAGTSAWQRLAACRGQDPGLWFPPETAVETVEDRRAREGEARAVCAACPVRSTCLEWAVAQGFRLGIWGGADLSPHHGPLCKNGLHPMDGDNAWLDGRGSLICLACRAATEERRTERLKGCDAA